MGEAQVRVGIIGAGENARDHARACRILPGFTLVAICDASAKALVRFGGEFQVPNRYRDLASMLVAHEFDLLIVSVWGVYHASIALEAMESGRTRAILVEKPLTMNAIEARRMTDVAEQTGVLLMEGFKWRYDPQHTKGMEIMRSGRLGDIRTVLGAFSSPMANVSDPAGWRFDASRGGGSLLDTASYLVHFARMVMGSEPLSVIASSDRGLPSSDAVERNASFLLDFGGGRTALLQSSYVQAFFQATMVIGTLGWMRFNTPFDARGSREAEFVTSQPLETTVEVFGNDFSHEVLRFAPCNQFEAQLASVAECLQTGVPALASGANAIGSMVVLDALKTSLRSGSVVVVRS